MDTLITTFENVVKALESYLSKTDVFYLNYVYKNALSSRDASFERKLF